MSIYIMKDHLGKIVYTSTSYEDTVAQAADVGGSYKDLRIDEWRGEYLVRRYTYSTKQEKWILKLDFIEDTEKEIASTKEILRSLERKHAQMTKEVD